MLWTTLQLRVRCYFMTVPFIHVAIATCWTSLCKRSLRMLSSRIARPLYCLSLFLSSSHSLSVHNWAPRDLRTTSKYREWWVDRQGWCLKCELEILFRASQPCSSKRSSPKKSLDHTLLLKVVNFFYCHSTTRVAMVHTVLWYNYVITVWIHGYCMTDF
jgi:hypothetical protein